MNRTTKITVSTFQAMKNARQKIAMLTAYDYSTAKLFDEAGIHGLLVGDSLGMVMLGYENTLPVTMEDMLHHTKAVVRGTSQALVVADMPFLSYHVSTAEAVANAGRLIKEGGAQAVKLEGGAAIADKVTAIVRAEIPVMGHLGLTPQSVHKFGGFKVQGKTSDAARQILDDALRLEEAGAFALVLECIPEAVAKLVSERLTIPTIGIGAGGGCDGQILVYQDMLGMYGAFKPKFVKQYACLGELMKGAVRQYMEEVAQGRFPAPEHAFSTDASILDKLY
ncbi:3-methyl-2-oxobutanoate hydroxymethyltransferase [Thermosinus carboxydivorans Nor1]|uniref:3-methyl-2-oxobutanoate hydroxymethyltransferase n=1 Tax=Thermosinus carboxydivorans Nor1 TaxID=401526 RepID=A1HUH7_9FIRM|nr:3-methyl-2-oxobutanoate hydroxymethyltransferase [Thermosinus carboxydivorans]EAX46318.1 3-methyl-2-oxobutanoate hydroxymethyltransferase [Thermosinus carboxydivorans Nor1]